MTSGDIPPEQTPDPTFEQEPDVPPPRPTWTYFLLPAAILLSAIAIAAGVAWGLSNDGGGDSRTESTIPGAAQSGASLLETFKGYAREVGADDEAFEACIRTDTPANVMNSHLQRGVGLGVNATPTFFVNNKMLIGAQEIEVFEEIIALEREDPPDSVDDYSERVQSLADSGRFRIVEAPIDIEGLDVEGNPDAPVVIAEFSDFQCPFCKRWVDETLPEIRELLGPDLALAFLHFPIVQIHPNAGNAGAAAVCAAEQGKFWEMHDLLFQRQDEWQNLR